MAKKIKLSTTDSDEEKRYIRHVLKFGQDGIVISLFAIESIEKVSRFVEHPDAHWEWGIVINRGMEPSERFPKTNIEVCWSRSENQRDNEFDILMLQLEDAGYKVININ